MHSVKRKIFWWIVASSVVVFLALTLGFIWVARPEALRKYIAEGLSEHLGLDANVGEVSIRLLPRPRLDATNLTLSVPNSAHLPPFVSIDHLWVDVGLLSFARRHVDTVYVEGLKIAVPPKSERREGGSNSRDKTDTKIVVNHLIARDAELVFVRADPAKRPLTFLIHDLKVDDLGFDRVIPFYAKLTNPVPTGLIESRGTFGPWQRGDPGGLPISGDYTFTDADLSTINGIGGTLSSVGKYEGHLSEISVTGETDTPNFSLELGGKPVPLKTKFQAIVDGTNGTTELVRVDAKMRNTAIITKGAITNLEGPGRHDIKLHVRIEDGRIEDVLALAIDSPKPMLVGDLSLESTLALPPGKTKVPQRLAMNGRFGLGRAEFTDAQLQEKLQELSRRSQGKDEDERIGRVLTDLRGRFAIQSGVLKLPDLTFRVPGASVALAGTYQLEKGEIDFAGTLRMQASVSRAVGGFKSIFLRPFDRLFRKDGAGAVVPIKITGTREHPDMSLQIGKVFKGGKD